MSCNEHGTVGRNKGRFAKKSVRKKLENLVERSRGNKWRQQSTTAVEKVEIVECTPEEYPKYGGRRVVELDQLADDLWCETCNEALSLRHLIKENFQGLVSHIKLRCKKCNQIFVVKTGKKSNGNVYDTNLKLGVAILDSGLGETNVNCVSSTLNIPPVPHTSGKRYERAAGKKMEELAKQSCAQAIQLEKELTIQEKNKKLSVESNCDKGIDDHIIEIAQVSKSPNSGNIPDSCQSIFLDDTISCQNSLSKSNSEPIVDTASLLQCQNQKLDKSKRQIISVRASTSLENDQNNNQDGHLIEQPEHYRLEKTENGGNDTLDANLVQRTNLKNQLSKDCQIVEEAILSNSSGSSNLVDNGKFGSSIGSLISQSGSDKNKSQVPVENEELGASIDAAWSKRGRAMNSMSGHSTVMGQFSGKVMCYAVRDIYCRKCRQGHPKNDHDCRANHTGSSKSMEADMAVEMILKNEQLVQAGCIIKILIGDDDSASMASLRKLSSYSIEKLSDFNHVKKTFNTKLYELKITASLIKYFARVFAMNIKKNEGNPVQVKVSLSAMIPHAFGDHSQCDSSCTRDADGIHHYKYFKDNKCLTDMNLKSKLEKIIKPYIDSHGRIAPCASSQQNESFNNTACSKHPKNKIFGGSESHAYRVAAAVCQKNMGHEYVVQLNSMMNLSPGVFTIKYRKRKQDSLVAHTEVNNSTAGKKRRVILKSQRSSKNTASQNKEGVTYESGCGYLDTTDLIDEAMIAENMDYNQCAQVVYDTETTGLFKRDQIVQIAAYCNGKSINLYILPSIDFSPDASRITRMEKLNGKLYYEDAEVETLSAREACKQFLFFLKNQGKPCVLIAHNGHRFDSPKLIELAKSVGLLNEFKLFVKGCSDSWYVLKDVLPQRVKEKLSFRQTDLVQEYLGGKDVENAHNALHDVMMLHNLLERLQVTISAVLLHTKSVDFILDPKNADPTSVNCSESLYNVKISTGMRKKNYLKLV